MGLRFYKRIKIFSWLTLNLSKSGISFSIGYPGTRANISKNKLRTTVGLPGTGISYSKTSSIKKVIDMFRGRD